MIVAIKDGKGGKDGKDPCLLQCSSAPGMDAHVHMIDVITCIDAKEMLRK
jgi:hypothetical protein